MERVQAKDLKLGDVIRIRDNDPDSYSDSTVHQIREGMVHLVRPYIQIADFSCTSGVIWYIGVENYKVFLDSDRTYFRIRKGPELK